MKPLTDKQARILEFIVEAVRRQGRPPTVREIAKRFRFASTNAARGHLAALEQKGYIEREFHASRNIKLAPELREQSGLPILGRVAAGEPILAVEHIDGYLSFDSLYPKRDGLFCLRVQGNSMVEKGILDGDYVVVRQQPDFENGEVGVAIVDGEATVKKVRRKGRFVELVPANKGFQTRRVDPAEQEFVYGGKVVGIHRSLSN